MSGITNQDIVDRIKKVGLQKCSEWLLDVAVQKGSNTSGNLKSFYSMCKRTYDKYQALRRHKGRKSGENDYEVFILLDPLESIPQTGKTQVRGRETSENIVFLQDKSSNLENVAHDISLELNTSKEENKELKTKLKARNAIGNIKKLKKQIKESKNNHRYLEKYIKSLQDRVQNKNSELKRLRSKINYYEGSVSKLREELEKKSKHVADLTHLIDIQEHDLNQAAIDSAEFENQIRDTETESNWLREMVNNSVITYDEDSKMYTAELQQCVFELLNYNVSYGNMSHVIQSVLQLVNCTANKLPSKSTVNNMNIQRLALSQKHIAEELTTENNICLLSDETNKFGTKIEGIHASDSRGNYWVLGLREMTTKAGKDILQTLLEILQDIDSVSDTSENCASKTLMKTIVSTMSDRAGTQAKFNELLEDFRTEVLKEDIGDQWDEMTDDEQMSLSRLCNFFCSLHALVHMAETSSKALIELENDIFTEPPILDKSFKKANEPGTVRLIRTACKAFSKGGDDKSGHYLNFSTYTKDFLTQNKLRTIPLERFRGNRFNILFRNAANVFFLKDHIKSYLEIDSSNRLLSAVKHDINVDEYLAGCKSLGLISELITVPLWCMIEDANVHIAESQTVYQELVEYLDNFSEHSLEFIQGKYVLSIVDEEKLRVSAVFTALTQEWQHDANVITGLQVLIPALCQLCRRLFQDYLPGGLWFDSSEEIKAKTVGVPKHNKFSESIFGHMDRLLREKPNTTQIATEANIMFIHNKTITWLKSKTQNERVQLVTEARKDVKNLRKQFKLRHEHIESERRRILAEKRAKVERAEEARIKKREDLTNEIQIWGLWQSNEEVDSEVERLKTKKDKMKAIKCQLNFRRLVLRQKHNTDKNVYKLSKLVNGKNQQLTVIELSANIKRLVTHSYREVSKETMEDEQMIVGKKVKHSFKDGTGENRWFIGQVISQVPGFHHWFNIKYTGDRAIYSYELLEDYKKGDLKLLV